MIYWLHRVGSAMAAVIPRSLAYALVSMLAGPTLVFYRRHRHNAVRNMHRVLGPEADRLQVQRLVDRVFINYGKYMVDVLRLPRLTTKNIVSDMVVYGLAGVDQGLARGKGLIVVTAHIGNWDQAGATMAAMGYPVNAIADTLEPPRWNEEVQAIRRRLHVSTIPIESGPKEMLRCLRRNEVLGILIDRPLVEEGVEVRFFGAPTRVPAGAATLALRTGASIVTAIVVREGSHYVGLVSPLLIPESTGNLSADVVHLTQRFMTQLEDWIRVYPDQWFMFRDMWPRVD